MESLIRRTCITFIITVVSVCCIYCLLATETYATEIDGMNKGVSYICPEEIDGNVDSEVQVWSTSKPSNIWNISSKGKYNFEGVSYHQTLYTNYKFTGKTSYKIYVNNTGDNKIKVKATNGVTTYASTTVGAGKTATLPISGLSKSTKFYISFSTNNSYSYSFYGYIK